MSYEDNGFRAFSARVANAVRGEDSTPSDMQKLHAGMGGYIAYQKWVDWRLARKWFTTPEEARFLEQRRKVQDLRVDVDQELLQHAGNDPERYWERWREMDPILWDAEERVARLGPTRALLSRAT